MLDPQDGPAIVAGHSYGGQVMTALGTDAPNVAGLVYIAAFGLDQGESVRRPDGRHHRRDPVQPRRNGLPPGELAALGQRLAADPVLFLQAGAVVTDGGGVLSHTAVIAREYGIPAVLATGEATRRLRDGDRVSVDGTTGTVTITSHASGIHPQELNGQGARNV